MGNFLIFALKPCNDFAKWAYYTEFCYPNNPNQCRDPTIGLNHDFGNCGPLSKPALLLGIPDTYFTHCCLNHDVCYGVCGKSKKSCDDDFNACMENTCNQLNWLHKNVCETARPLYMKALEFGGQEAYDDTQTDNCCSKN